MLTLALSDKWTIGLFALQMIFNVLFGLGMLWVKRKADETDTLKSELKENAKQIIDHRFETFTAQFNGLINQLNQAIDTVNARLKSGDADMRELNQRDHKLELKFNTRVDELKQYIREHCVTKEDLKNWNHKP